MSVALIYASAAFDATFDGAGFPARQICDDVIELCHRGPMSRPDCVAIALDHCPEVGSFFGAASTVVAELAITAQVRQFADPELKSTAMVGAAS